LFAEEICAEYLRMNEPKMPYFAELIFADGRKLVKSKFRKHLI